MNQTGSLPESALVLVGVMPSPKDMEIARLLGWYRIPFRMAPKMLDVDYLLFYQTWKFPDSHNSRIETYAEVRGHELTTRGELIRNEPDHPRSKEEYYKISLGEVMRLPKAILPKRWNRISFFYTLGSLVNQADVIDDLIVRSEDREILWKTIREREPEKYGKKVDDLPSLPESELAKLIQQVIGLNSDLLLSLDK